MRRMRRRFNIGGVIVLNNPPTGYRLNGGPGLLPRISPCSMSLKLYRCPPSRDAPAHHSFGQLTVLIGQVDESFCPGDHICLLRKCVLRSFPGYLKWRSPILEK